MPQSIVNINAAKTRLSRLVARAEKGERITIARAGKPVAELIPVPKTRRRSAPADDPLLRTEEYAFEGPLRKLTNAEADRVVYGV